MLFYCVMGVILGGRVGSVIFYNLDVFLSDPLMIFRIWEGGMSFHGGLLGVIAAMIIYARKLGLRFLQLTDFGGPIVPIGLGFGRIGNFINGELWGKVSDVPWAMVFPRAGIEPRHPSQLYEFALEGVLMFTVLWLYSRKPRPIGAVSGLFLILYSLCRFAIEFVREPDIQLGYLAFGWVTMGQLLSLPMLIGGIWLMVSAARRAPLPAA
jgi:phosphatidylglycerol:prolipoprotein diacylglycerol transferase